MNPGASRSPNPTGVRSQRPCSAPGCGTLTKGGRCSVHQRQRDRERGSAKERGYGGSWPKLRAMVLREEPLCRECGKNGFITPATEVDHIIPMSRGGARLDRSNLAPLCGTCHRRKTNAEKR